jgi:hypothetical protein
MAFAQKKTHQASIPAADHFSGPGFPETEKEFVCPEESKRYASILEMLLLNKLQSNNMAPAIVEFGSGRGEPVISAIVNSKFKGTVYGYEINPLSCEGAEQLIAEQGLLDQYIISNISFFETQRMPKADYLIANPPYLPCASREQLILPYLCGGPDGDEVTRKLLARKYRHVLLEVSSYSNPVAVVKFAQSQGYKIADFLVGPLPFGPYSRQDIVQKRIREMKAEGKAFFAEDHYLVGSAQFTLDPACNNDLSKKFLDCLTSVE